MADKDWFRQGIVDEDPTLGLDLTSIQGRRFPMPGAGGNGKVEQGRSDFRPFLVRKRMADVQPEAVTWVWPNRIPAGKLTLMVGDPEVGKSFVSLDCAARLSRCTPWPDARDTPVTPGATVIMSAEDDPADTILPRLVSGGADLSRIFVLESAIRGRTDEPAHINLDVDLAALERSIVDVSARMAILDPISAYLGRRDGHSNTDIRGILTPLAHMAQRTKCAILCVSHLNKSGNGPAMYRPMGSLAFVAAARLGWLIAKDENDDQQRVMVPIKCNLIERPTGLRFEIADGVVNWSSEPVTECADALLAASGTGRTERAEAQEFLLELLSLGPLSQREIKTAAEGEGHMWRTIVRAKKGLGIRSAREGYGKHGRSVWSLPEEATDSGHTVPPGEWHTMDNDPKNAVSPILCHSPESGTLCGDDRPN